MDIPSSFSDTSKKDEPDDLFTPTDLRQSPDLLPPPSPPDEETVAADPDDPFDDPLMQRPQLGHIGHLRQPEPAMADTDKTDASVETPVAPEVMPKEEEVRAAIGEKAVGQAVAVVADKNAEQPAPQQPIEAKNATLGDDPRDDRQTEQPSQPVEADDAAVSAAPPEGGGDEPPRPPRPPEGNDGPSGESEGDGEDERRLEKEMRDYLRIVKPIFGVAEHADWMRTASAADRELHAELHEAMAALPQKLMDGNYGELKEYADKTAAKLLEEKENCSAGEAMGIHMMASAHVVDSYRTVVGRDQSKADDVSDKGTYFLAQFANTLAWRLPGASILENPDPVAMYEKGRQSSEAVAGFMGESKGWIDAKLHGFTVALKFREASEYQVVHEVPLETASLRDLKRYNDKFMGMVDSKRQHTIKPATHEGEGTAWSIHDYQDMRSRIKEAVEANKSEIQLHEWAPKMRMVALEHHPDDPDAERSIITPTFTSLGNDHPKESGRIMARVCYMDNKGELYADMNGGMPLRDLYERHDKIVNYEALRQYMITTYSRLTVPIGVEREAQDATERVMGREANQMPQGRDPENREVVHDLLLPRISVLRRYSKQEIAEMERTELRAGEVVDEENNVVGHTRKINPEYQASQLARDEAANYGITLPPRGMTFVKAHYHPLAGKAGTHRAKRRKDGDEADVE